MKLSPEEVRKTILEFNNSHAFRTHSFLESKLRAIGLTSEQIAGVFDAIDGTCHDCWDSYRGCQCSNDE